jgi:hypothetical protein
MIESKSSRSFMWRIARTKALRNNAQIATIFSAIVYKGYFLMLRDTFFKSAIRWTFIMGLVYVLIGLSDWF